MPLYEYECRRCGHRFEKIQSFNAPPETQCPACGGEVERLISAPAVQFKGSGWYVTDYAAKGGAGKAAKNDTAPAEGGGAAKESSGAGANASEATKPAATTTANSSSGEKI